MKFDVFEIFKFLLICLAVMLLWNSVIVDVFELKRITFVDSILLYMFSNVIFKPIKD